MSAFRWFLEEFRAEDRQLFDIRRVDEADASGEDSSMIECAYRKERPEKKMYQYYLERMRETGQTNLNLDVLDLLAFRSSEGEQMRNQRKSKKDQEYYQLYNNLMLYPQEIIPILDQVLKDCAVDWAENNLGGVSDRVDNLVRAEALLAASFKVRPFGGERKVNMRELNPQG